MALAVGTCLGPYEILSPLGVGGMGEVYRARHRKLERDVAIKILPEALAADPERIARFEREAKTLAALNHPSIAHIHGLEESDGIRALVLELVDGPTLADRIAQGPIPLDETLAIARQIAEALEAAHEQGIVHRDLKPANVKVRADGVVKVLDFGLAKAIEPTGAASTSLSMSPTITSPAMTQAGIILGTAAYMSPEQAKGLAADKRSDLWAFGSVLFEMLAGRRAFEADDVSDTLALVLRGEPDWNALPPDVPVAIRKLIKGCLERERRQRVGDIAAVRYVLRDASAATAREAGATAQGSQQPAWHRAVPVAAALVAVGVVGIVAGRAVRPAATPPKVVRFAVTLPAGQRFNETGGQIIAISPDGSHIAYVANQRIYARALSEQEARPIAGTEANANRLSNVVFSPDGQSLAFSLTTASAVTGGMRRVPLAGGTPVTLGAVDERAGPDLTWRGDGIVFVDRRQGSVVHLDGNGRLERLAAIADGMIAKPQLLPDGDTLLFALAPGIADNINAAPDTWDKAKIIVQSRKTGERTTLIEGGGAPTYVPTGHLLYAVGGTLFAAPFDYQRRQLTGGGVSVIEGVGRFASAVSASSTVYYGVADNGTLIYVPGRAGASVGQFDVAYVDAKEQVERLKLPPATYSFPRLSRDEKRLAVQADDGKNTNVWIYDLSGITQIRQLTLSGKNRYPVWSGDGSSVAFQSDREGDLGIFTQRADGSSRAERLTKPESGSAHIPESWSPDGRTLLYCVAKGQDFELWGLSLPEKKAYRFGDVHSLLDPTAATFSPDGRLIAYLTTQGDTRTVFVERFPSDGVKHSIGTGIWHPAWSSDGRQLFYRGTGSREYVVHITVDPALSIGKPEVIATTRWQTRGRVEREYDIARDGRFVAIVAGGQSEAASSGAEMAPTQQINVVVNWTEELKQRVPVK